MNTLKDSVVLVVGASSGMGAQIARTFAQEQARVVLAARNREQLAQLAQEIGEQALAVPTDVQDADAVDHLITTTLQEFGAIDILIYNTGTNIPDRSLEVLTDETWEMMLNTNLSGAFFCTKRVLPIMRKQRHGLLIYIASACVKMPDVSGVAYQASKHGVVGLAHGTFQEEKQHGIRTSVIFPGLTDTPLVLKRPVPTPPEVVRQALQPQDVADACLFIAQLPPRAYVPELTLLPAGLA
ncbi:SDR family NAD(P)-dependent oxidoreductase [candidate division KSB3 bacterium]|uniref:SDR family NAD(P)-dependent oxidoreductase n=1 Tax=candidate division KSB3 bacterium TaxID=2044937 RepID=A0A9D5K0K5_9BACT|nr:SDR family NAD(P)-dependent oxidoreductase [candidate division KSB3 bacterium]MBD3327573.1 SDR family NAD(P)-dependent oxidoreductase [candidate division KSB3 bacterium]